MREAQIEQKLCKRIRAIGGLCIKFVSHGLPGVPDRIVLAPPGRIYFVELKTEVGRLSKIQKWVRRQFEKVGFPVRVLRGMEAVEAFAEEVARGGVSTVPVSDVLRAADHQ